MATFEDAGVWLRAEHPVVDESTTYLILRLAGQRVRAVHCVALDEDTIVVASAICANDLLESGHVLVQPFSR